MAQAKENLSLSEFRSWVKYRRRRGSLHLGMRVERSVAMLAALTANLHRDPQKRPAPYSWKDFALHEDEDGPISLEEAIASWA
ncbi:phage tail assembly protein T [Pseudomonas sp. NBRC 111125]|uniref:phage tail assembly protein T n=1 Tax=Pseudomonas sp. NBRC 111125 TaxID=1661040 RepID=UPI0040356512